MLEGTPRSSWRARLWFTSDTGALTRYLAWAVAPCVLDQLQNLSFDRRVDVCHQVTSECGDVLIVHSLRHLKLCLEGFTEVLYHLPFHFFAKTIELAPQGLSMFLPLLVEGPKPAFPFSFEVGEMACPSIVEGVESVLPLSITFCMPSGNLNCPVWLRFVHLGVHSALGEDGLDDRNWLGWEIRKHVRLWPRNCVSYWNLTELPISRDQLNPALSAVPVCQVEGRPDYECTGFTADEDGPISWYFDPLMLQTF